MANRSFTATVAIITTIWLALTPLSLSRTSGCHHHPFASLMFTTECRRSTLKGRPSALQKP